MIRYTVVWQKDAESQLTTLWCDRTNRQAIAEAADQVDAVLSTDALDKGVSLPDDFRELSVPPLTIGFKVDEGDRKVIVVLVKLIQ